MSKRGYFGSSILIGGVNMKFFLVYVDAENLSKEEVLKTVSLVKSTVSNSEMFIGKVYGSLRAMKESMETYLDNGFEFVDTSSFFSGHKNSADMKIVSDCCYDAFRLYNDCVQRIMVVSKDADFLPMIYKLRGKGLEVITPFMHRERCSTVGDVVNKLKQKNWDPISSDSDPFENKFDEVVALLDDVDEELIIQFFRSKQKGVLQSIKTYMSSEDYYSLANIECTEFCFHDIVERLHDTVDDKILMLMARAYFNKLYGYCPKSSVINEVFENVGVSVA